MNDKNGNTEVEGSRRKCEYQTETANRKRLR